VVIFTIGFTQKSAEEFFSILKRNGIRRLIDVRLNNSGQLAGFTKSTDLRYFLRELCGADYVHMPELAPTKELLSDYRAKKITWQDYERVFDRLMTERRIETALDPTLFAEPAVLLCSEPTADKCHRRLVAEYLQHSWEDVRAIHL
jgi:uncharacterized protein (DUF488 family)